MNRFLNFGNFYDNYAPLCYGRNNYQLKILTFGPAQFGAPFPFPLFLSKLPKVSTPPFLRQY